MFKVYVKKSGSRMNWFGAMPDTISKQIENLKKQGFEIVKVTDRNDKQVWVY